MIQVLEFLIAIPVSTSIIFHLLSLLFTLSFFLYNGEIQQKSTELVSTSVLVPICGVDFNAEKNWSSLCEQYYPEYEVLFGVVDPEDPAVPIIKQIIQNHPRHAKLFTDLKPRGINHKDSTLSYLLEEAQYDQIIFIDSDIQVEQDYIQTVTAPLQDKRVGMVTCAFLAHTPQTITSALASFGRCFDFIPSLLIMQQLDKGLKCAIGTTIATRRDALSAYGGLHLSRIGSDYNIGKRAAKAGYIVKLSSLILENDTGQESFQELFTRELRWARTIRFNRGWQYYTMIFTFGAVFWFPLLWLSNWSEWALGLVVVGFLIRSIQVFVCSFAMAAPSLNLWLWLLPLREGLSFMVWLLGSYGQNIVWRGRELQVSGDGIISLKS